jgi:hypothetical protein
MRRRLDMLVATVVAATAIGALMVPGALAVTGHFTAESYPAELIGEQGPTHVFVDASGFEVTCLVVLFKGTLTAKSEKLTLAPEYNNCHAVVSGISMPATVTENGCTYRLNGTTGQMDILCPPEKKLEIHTYASKTKHANAEPVCTYTIGLQEGLEGLTYENKGSGTTKDLSIQAKLPGIAYTRHGFSFLCSSHSNSGTYTGLSTLEAFSSKQIALDIG